MHFILQDCAQFFFCLVHSKNLQIFFKYVYFIFWIKSNQVWILYRNVLTQLTKMPNPSAIVQNIFEHSWCFFNVVKHFWPRSIVRFYLDSKLTHLSIVKNIWPNWKKNWTRSQQFRSSRWIRHNTLTCQIIVQQILLFFGGKKHLHNLIRTYTFINFWDFSFKTWFSPT